MPTLFHKDVSFSAPLGNLPTQLEKDIEENSVPEKDIIIRRFKGLVVPLNFGIEVCLRLLEYFLLNSSFTCEQECQGDSFPFKLISCQLSMVPLPFNRPCLNEKSAQEGYRAFTFLFDTEAYHDRPFWKIVSEIHLHQIFPESTLEKLDLVLSTQILHLHEKCLKID